VNSSLSTDREKAAQVAVEDEIKRLAEQLLDQVNKVNEIAHLLVGRIESSRDDG
jgi:hypothetical protein